MEEYESLKQNSNRQFIFRVAGVQAFELLERIIESHEIRSAKTNFERYIAERNNTLWVTKIIMTSVH
jgi:hypothetical protein